MRTDGHPTTLIFDVREVIQGTDCALELHALLFVGVVVGAVVGDVVEDAAKEVSGLGQAGEHAHVDVGGGGDGEELVGDYYLKISFSVGGMNCLLESVLLGHRLHRRLGAGLQGWGPGLSLTFWGSQGS